MQCRAYLIFGLTEEDTGRRVATVGEMLEAGDLFDQPVRTLSLGQRMRCELTACMLHEPELLFLDEPTIGLDLLAKQRFRELLVRLNTELGTTVFLTSHDVADIEQVAERAIIVNDGSIVYDAPVARMRNELLQTKRIEVTLERSGDAAQLRDALDGEVTFDEPAPGLVGMELDTAATPVRLVLDRILDTVDVADVSIIDAPLEQIISDIYEDAP